LTGISGIYILSCVLPTGAEYKLKAKQSARDNTKVILATRNNFVIYIRKEDLGKAENKHGVRIGGIFNGRMSIYDRYTRTPTNKFINI
jgi:hypothetical protein